MQTTAMVSVLVYCLISLLLLFVVVEDFKYRAVSWWAFPLLAVGFIGIDFPTFSWLVVLINSGLVLLHFLILASYCSWKEGRWVNITKSYLGLGDVLIWGAFCFLFSPINFMFYLMGSLLIVLMVVGVVKLTPFAASFNTIPLAGMQALLAIPLVWISYGLSTYSVRNESWIEKIVIQ